MRFMAAPWISMLANGAWLRRAGHANEMAALLHEELQAIAEVRVLFPRQANSVFVELPPWLVAAMRSAGWKFYTFIGQGGCRFMCAWDTQPDDVHALVGDLKRLVAGGPPTGFMPSAGSRQAG
jgi:threonine aldolase